MLDGLLCHESDLEIREHYIDTAGFTDHVFALMHLLGFAFCPRSKDLHDKKPFIKGKVDLKLVWLERGHPRAGAVADVLSSAGFPDFGKQLQQLAKEPSPR